MHELNNLTSLNFSFHSGSAYSTTGVDQFLNKLIVWADFIWAFIESAYSTTSIDRLLDKLILWADSFSF